MAEQEPKFDMKRIAGTLKHGQFDGNKRKYLIAAYIATIVLSFGLALGLILTLIIFGLKEKGGMTGDYVGAIIGCVVAAFIFPVLFGIFFIRNEKRRKEIMLWLDDAVELQGYVRELAHIDDYIELPPFQIKTAIKVRVEFKYEGKKLHCDSREKILGSDDDGYSKIWKYYVGKKVDILYSPKYKEVIMLKLPNDSMSYLLS